MRTLITDRSGVLVFVLTAAAGFAAWFLGVPYLADTVLEAGAEGAIASSPLLAFYGAPLAALAAAAAGFASPNGFWLWGVAASLPRPIAGMLLPFYENSRYGDYGRYRDLVGSPTDFLGQRLLLEVVGFLVFAAVCTAAAALGAGLRSLWRRRRGGHAGSGPSVPGSPGS